MVIRVDILHIINFKENPIIKYIINPEKYFKYKVLRNKSNVSNIITIFFK